MDTLLIPLFIVAVLSGLIVVPVLALYAVPVRCGVAYCRETGGEGNTVSASWGPVGGSVSRRDGLRVSRIFFCGREIWCRSGPDEHRKGGPAGAGPPGAGLPVTDIPGIVAPLLGDAGAMIREVYRQSYLEGMTGRIRIGLENPAATGLLYGMYRASRFILDAAGITVAVEPVFSGQVLEVDVVMKLRIRHPLMILARGLAIARNPAVRRLMAARVPAGAGE
ncbi:MAG TPA: hypothetical protein VLY83_05295 [Methanoregula sp.]|nr:hypothetical protein [Methanoregula sp.]